MASKFSSKSVFVLFLVVMVCFTGGGALLSWGLITYGVFFIVSGIFGVLRLWYIIQHTNRSIAFFFDSIRNNDTSVAFSTSTENKSLNFLHNSLNELGKHIQKFRMDAELKEKYYQSVIKQSYTGFIILTRDKEVKLINDAACNFAGINPLSTNLKLLKLKNPGLYDAACKLKGGENTVYKNISKFSVQQLLLKATEIKTQHEQIMLITIQDIKSELNEKEIESYQKLISILTHEIMNSLAPIASLSKTLNTIFANSENAFKNSDLNDIQIHTTLQGLKAIESQSQGLMEFVSNYRKLTKIPHPVIKRIDVKEWMEQISLLYKERLHDKNILLEISADPGIDSMDGDKNLLHQVLANILNNAMDALEEKPVDRRIKLSIKKNQRDIIIRIGNNGPAIPTEIQEKVFIPFFTTRENGSGIGLSVSQQIIHMHKGTLDVFSTAEDGTIFTITI